MKVIISYDTTGSMFPALNEVKRRLQETIAPLFQSIPDLKLGFIAHGDYHDFYEPQWSGYTEKADVLSSFVHRIGTTSGYGNGGERYEDIFHTVNDLKPDVYIMIADEPAHIKGKCVFPGTIVLYDIYDELNIFLNNGGTFYLVRCLDRFDSRAMHAKLVAMANTPMLSLHQFADIPELLSAIVYKQTNALVQYADDLESGGRLNVNLAALIDSLLDEQRYSKNAQTKTLSKIYNKGLVPVDPTRFQVLKIDHAVEIREFVHSMGIPYVKGRGFYLLTKPEIIQENKEVILQDNAGLFYTGAEARDIIGIPYGQRGRVYYDKNLPYKVFIQSTSVNRKLQPNTLFLYEVSYA